MRSGFLALITMAAGLAQSQISGDALDKAKRLTVMINATTDGDTRPGAGIIFAVANDRVYIATANHLLRRGQAEAGKIQVEFQWLPGQPIPAQLLADYDDRALDLAVITVDTAKAHLGQIRLPFERRGDPSSVAQGIRAPTVWAIGYPNGAAWDTSTAQISKVEGLAIKYRMPGGVPGGYSGGPLVDSEGMILGVIRQDTPPNGEAARIDLVVNQLRAWEYQIGLETFSDVLLRMVAGAPSGFRDLGAPQSGPEVWTPTVIFTEAVGCGGKWGADTHSPFIECVLFASKDYDFAVREFGKLAASVSATLPDKEWQKVSWAFGLEEFINEQARVAMFVNEESGPPYEIVLRVGQRSQ